MGYLALERGDWDRARVWFEDSLRTLHQIKQLTTRFTYILPSSLEGLAVIAWVSKEPLRAAWLLGAANTQRHTGAYIDPRGRAILLWEKTREAVLKTLGTAAFTRTFAEGSRMTPIQALATQEPEKNTNEPFSAENSELPEGDSAPVPADTQPSSHEGLLPLGEHLTRREVEVLRLLAQGLSNAEIAEQLVLSVVTVTSYLRSVYSKLGVSSRTRAARYALDHHLI
jgi:DNA-binding CsgD family transcriptional regulator